MPQPVPTDFSLTFADFPCGIPAYELFLGASSDSRRTSEEYCRESANDESSVVAWNSTPDAMSLNCNAGTGSLFETHSPEYIRSSTGKSDFTGSLNKETMTSDSTYPATSPPRKRRRRPLRSSTRTVCTSVSADSHLLSSINTAFLADGLLRIYQDSFENHLSCWLTEQTCPYRKDCGVSLPNDSGPDWNHIYHRVFKLDNSPSIRGRLLSAVEDRAATKALNLAIVSFASQWVAPVLGMSARYPFRNIEQPELSTVPGGLDKTALFPNEFDRTLQLTAWHKARQALHETANIESFRVVLAHIVFSLTQKVDEKHEHSSTSHQNHSIATTVKQDTQDCEDLMSRLNLSIDTEGPAAHLEHGLRLVHSLRSRMTLTGAYGGRRKKKPRASKHNQIGGLGADDRATVDVLFWLGIIFDTLSSAIHKRPLVVSQEDSEALTIRGTTQETASDLGEKQNSDTKVEDLWDEFLFSHQRKRRRHIPAKWPCSQFEASAILCEAAPIKVLLFRKVTRIQTLLSRRAQGIRIEAAVHSALEVCEYWQKTYGPFLRACIDDHDHVPPQTQSWYVCLAAHWHLATLLLADLIEMMDESECGTTVRRQERELTKFVTRFRSENAFVLSDVAKRACTVGREALMSEPWSDVLIRAFATAAAVLLEPVAGQNKGDCYERAESCVKALQSLGKRSDGALLAAGMIREELRRRREDVSSFLDQNESGTENME